MRRLRTVPGFPQAQSGIPVSLAAVTFSNSQINLTATYGGTVPVTTYNFYILIGFSWSLLVSQASRTYSNTGLTPNTQYTYYVSVSTADGRISMPSPVASANTTLAAQTATPTFSPSAGTYTGTQSVVLSCGTSGASIYYTLDGTTPTVGSTLYTAPISVTASETIKAIAQAPGDSLSTVAIAAYTIVVGGSLAITTTALPAATVGGTYFYQMAASGGQPPYQWGQIGPNYFGGFNYSVNVPVSNITQTTNAVFTLTSSATTHPFTGQTQVMLLPAAGTWPKSLYMCGAITSLTGSSGAWLVNTNIDFSNSSYGPNNGTSDLLNCNLVAGPTGVNPYQLTLTGMLEVAPTVAETANLPFIVMDNTGALATVTLPITVNTTLQILGRDLSKSVQPMPPVAMVGNSYQQQFLCAGGTGTGQTWSFSGLPPGMVPNASTGVISGIPTTANPLVTFTATVTDSAGPPVSASFSMIVQANANVTRPPYNTGTGFFVSGAQLYDPNGAPFRIRGMNQNHFDDTLAPTTMQILGANTSRIFSYSVANNGYTAASFTPIIAATIAKGIVPIFTMNGTPGFGITTASITGTTGQFSCNATTVLLIVGNTVTISGTNTGTGSVANGKYYISATNGSTTFTLQTTLTGGTLSTTVGTLVGLSFTPGGSSNNTNPADLTSIANWWASNYLSFAPYQTQMMINIANEFDMPDAQWQASYLSAVSTIRGAGYTCPLVIDASGDGQDYLVIVSGAAAIQAADPQKNCIFSWHAYGAAQNIQAQITSITKGASNTVIGINFVGPYNPFQNFEMGYAPSGSNGLPHTVYVSGVGGMTQINGLTLNTVSATANGNSGAYSVTVSLNSSAFSTFTSGGTLYSGVHVAEVVAPQLAALASSNVCCIIGELGPGKNIGTNAASPTSVTNAQVVAAAEANNLGWLYWALDDNNLASSSTSQNWYGALTNYGIAYANPSQLTYVGLDAAFNPNTGVNGLASPASYFVGGSVLPPSNFLPAGHWVAANQTLQMIYPLTDGATSANAYHHWAYYDGTNPITYQVPIVAMGGSYPYVFTIDSSSAGLGMSIGASYGSANYGVVTWSPSGTLTGHTVTVTVTDQQLNTTSAVFTVSTSSATSHFVFLDQAAGSDSTGNGTFATPWQTLGKAFGTTFAATGAGAGAICYTKSTGTYSTSNLLYTDNDINSSQPYFEMHPTRKPIALVGLGGQAVIDWTSGVWALAIGNSSTDIFLANLNPNGYGSSVPNQKWVFFGDTSGGQRRFTEWNCTWTNSGYGSSGTSVASPHTAADIGGSTLRSYIALLGFTEPSRVSGSPGNNYAGFCLYSCTDTVTDGFTINNPSSTYDGVCYYKGTNTNFEARNHFINVASTNAGAVLSTPGFFDTGEPTSTSGEVRYCYIGQSAAGTRQRIGTQAGTYGTFYLNRNTVIGFFENSFGGTGFYTNNVVQTTGTPIPTGAGSTSTGNVTATSGIINSTTLQLQGTATSSVGIAGAQIG